MSGDPGPGGLDLRLYHEHLRIGRPCQVSASNLGFLMQRSERVWVCNFGHLFLIDGILYQIFLPLFSPKIASPLKTSLLRRLHEQTLPNWQNPVIRQNSRNF